MNKLVERMAERSVGVEQALGLEGLGSFVVKQALDQDTLWLIQEEIFDPCRVAWRDNHDRFVNQRGIEVIENHLVFALKLRGGDPTWINRVPRMRQLAEGFQTYVRSYLGGLFSGLDDWTADEMSLHRYDDPDIGLSFHKDNLRFTKVIGIAELEANRDFEVKMETGEIISLSVEPGDFILSRATGLYEVPPGPEGKPVNLCPEHGVYNLKQGKSTSFIVRANSKPQYSVPGFEYDNWVGIPEEPTN